MLFRSVKIGNCSGAGVDKFAAFGLTPVAASQVKAPLIEECFANIECRVIDRKMIDRYNMFILEAVAAWRDPRPKNPKTFHHHGFGRFVADGRAFTLKSAKA